MTSNKEAMKKQASVRCPPCRVLPPSTRMTVLDLQDLVLNEYGLELFRIMYGLRLQRAGGRYIYEDQSRSICRHHLVRNPFQLY